MRGPIPPSLLIVRATAGTARAAEPSEAAGAQDAEARLTLIDAVDQKGRFRGAGSLNR